MRRGWKVKRLLGRLNEAMHAGRLTDALAIYKLLETADPNEPRWPHRRGDLVQRIQQKEPDLLTQAKLKSDAADAYERAVELYAAQGFIARATAMAKMILGMDPERTYILEKLQPDEARRLHRKQRQTIVTADETFVEEPATGRSRIVEDAFELAVDSSAAADEIRFVDPEEGVPTSEIDVSQMELMARPSHAPAEWDLDHLSAEQLAQLPSTPLFAEVPQEVFIQIVSQSTLVDLTSEQELIRAGDPAAALFVIVEGSVEVQPEDGDTPLTLGEGDVVGVACLLADVTYRETVVARGRVRTLQISKVLLDGWVEQYPAVGDVLLEILGRRLISGFIRTNALFEAFDEETRFEVAKMFEVRRAPAGTRLLDTRKRSDGLYIPLLGELAAYDREGQRLGRLKLGRAVGQWSLLTRGPAAINVQAESEALVLRMPAKRFHQLAGTQPAVVVHLRQLARVAIERDGSLRPASHGR